MGSSGLSGMERPIRVAQKLAGDEHAVGVAALDDRVGLQRIGDETDRSRRDARLAPDPRGERYLIAG
jgi:hypothetical protein